LTHWKGVGVTLFVNWAVKPFSMALLGWVFIRQVFAPWLPAEQIDAYMAGLILLAAAPCTAMVFVWSNLSDGEPHFTLTQVALNDTIMVFAFAPIVGLLLGLSSITVPWETLLLSVGIYIVIPVLLSQLWRNILLRRGGQARLKRTLDRLAPIALLALLATLVLLFGFQGRQILAHPALIAMLAVPILIQVYFNSGLAYVLNRSLGVAHCVAAPSALIGASNFFELAVATAVSLEIPGASTAGRVSLDTPAVVLTPRLTKGLEFDTVIVVEPTAIVAERDRGKHDLYVALSRATQRLIVVHAEPLPDGMARITHVGAVGLSRS